MASAAAAAARDGRSCYCRVPCADGALLWEVLAGWACWGYSLELAGLQSERSGSHPCGVLPRWVRS